MGLPGDGIAACANCGRNFGAASKRCIYCGAIKGRLCTKCRTVVPVGAEICLACNSAIAPTAPNFVLDSPPIGDALLASATPRPTHRSLWWFGLWMLTGIVAVLVVIWYCSPAVRHGTTGSTESSSLPPLTTTTASQPPAISPGPDAVGTTIPPQPDVPEGPLERRVNLFRPYPVVYRDAPTDRITIQYAVIELGKQAGLRYNWPDSYRNTQPTCRYWVQPDLHDERCDDALRAILGPKGLSFTITDGTITLHMAATPDEALERKVTLVGPVYPLSYPNAATDKMAVQYAVIELGKQAGIRYNWAASYKNTDPVCKRWVRPSIHNMTCKDALRQLLDPVGLAYRIEEGQIVLVRK